MMGLVLARPRTVSTGSPEPRYQGDFCQITYRLACLFARLRCRDNSFIVRLCACCRSLKADENPAPSGTLFSDNRPKGCEVGPPRVLAGPKGTGCHVTHARGADLEQHAEDERERQAQACGKGSGEEGFPREVPRQQRIVNTLRSFRRLLNPANRLRADTGQDSARGGGRDGGEQPAEEAEQEDTPEPGAVAGREAPEEPLAVGDQALAGDIDESNRVARGGGARRRARRTSCARGDSPRRGRLRCRRALSGGRGGRRAPWCRAPRRAPGRAARASGSAGRAGGRPRAPGGRRKPGR